MMSSGSAITLAITGGTGFVGRHLLDLAIADVHHVRALTRRDQSARKGVTWIKGDLSDVGALCEGADAVVHVAGVVNARDEAGFRAGNVDGTATVIAAAEAARVSRFVHVSSLAAREPELSRYGASKAAADALVRESDLDWTILRPPAVYGPGETERLDIYRLAQKGLGVAPGRGRFSLIYVTDLARALLALATSAAGIGETYEIEDGTGGLDHASFARLVGRGVGRDVRVATLPLAALSVGAALDGLRARIAGGLPKLSRDRARYIAHPDWTASVDPLVQLGIWSPEVDPEVGIARTATWYREKGLI
ncbi:MAG: NAD(P)H-binding protein [Pacificimonas sp.]